MRACYSEGRAARCWSPGLRLLPENAPETASALDEEIDRDQLERGLRRLSARRSPSVDSVPTGNSSARTDEGPGEDQVDIGMLEPSPLAPRAPRSSAHAGYTTKIPSQARNAIQTHAGAVA